ncbi:MAG TPA: aminopeptidase [Kiritimatiellae bacterium]|nr:aminopeptidase [Kiritimatiellia bacterium]
MEDPRVRNLARILVRYSIRAREGQTVSVDATPQAEPLVKAVYLELIRAGAFPVVRMAPAALNEIFLRFGRRHHFTTVTAYHRAFVRTVDASIRIASSPNTRALSRVDPRRQALLVKTHRTLRDRLLKKPWVLTLYPTQAYAQDAEMSLSEFEDFVYQATFADDPKPVSAWKALARRQERMIARLEGARRVRIVGDDTDLRMSIEGRRFINSPGTHNMPSGEIFTGPVEGSVEGHIAYDFPVCHAGREIAGIRLVFRRGRVVEASAEKNEKFLLSMLDSDPGARRVGELGIGTNMRIQRFTRNILFDEKIGGTVHLALGNSYPETGGRNRSAIHWDMIKDLRRGGTLYIDGRPVISDGKFRL